MTAAAGRKAVVFHCLAALLLCGCVGQPTEETAEAHAAGEEQPSFARQAAAVRRGESKRIRVTQATVGDAQLRELAGLENLEQVNLRRGRFTDEGLQVLSTLPNLTHLRFHSPEVTDAGMAHIRKMEKLRALHVIDTPITDRGLEHLYGMSWLESFYLDGGNCTADGLAELLENLPELHFHLDQLHLPDDPKKHPH